MLLNGNNEIPIRPGQKIIVNTDTEITVDGRKTYLFEHVNNKRRKLDDKEDACIETVVITAPKSNFYTVEIRQVYEDLDPNPVEIPENKRGPKTVREEMRELVVNMLQERYGSGKFDTFEDSMDFDIDDEIDFVSNYEVDEMLPIDELEEVNPELEPDAPVASSEPESDTESDTESTP